MSAAMLFNQKWSQRQGLHRERTKIAVSLYFSFPPGSTDSSMLVVSDIDDVFLPKATGLLVESRASLKAGRIGHIFQDNTVIGSALGPALQAGCKLMTRYSLLRDCL